MGFKRLWHCCSSIISYLYYNNGKCMGEALEVNADNDLCVDYVFHGIE